MIIFLTKNRCPPCLRTPVHHVSGLYTSLAPGYPLASLTGCPELHQQPFLTPDGQHELAQVTFEQTHPDANTQKHR
jgi:hypothetical protein